MHVEPQMRQGLLWLADLGVGVARVIGAVEDIRIGGRQVLGIVTSYGVEHGRGARVLTGVEKRRAEEVAKPEPERRVMTSAFDAVLEKVDRFGRAVIVQ